MHEMLDDPRLWVATAFILFFALSYKKIMGFATRALDERSARIKADLDQAQFLREEAEKLLADYKRKQAEYLKEAEMILVDARKDAEIYSKQAEQELKVSLEARMKQAIEKIAQEEEKAVQEVRNHVVDIALAAARTIIVDYVSNLPQDELVKLAITDIERKIH
jgi:F-type H+-transporting ATPase subunit b